MQCFATMISIFVLSALLANPLTNVAREESAPETPEAQLQRIQNNIASLLEETDNEQATVLRQSIEDLKKLEAQLDLDAKQRQLGETDDRNQTPSDPADIRHQFGRQANGVQRDQDDRFRQFEFGVEPQENDTRETYFRRFSEKLKTLSNESAREMLEESFRWMQNQDNPLPNRGSQN